MQVRESLRAPRAYNPEIHGRQGGNGKENENHVSSGRSDPVRELGQRPDRAEELTCYYLDSGTVSLNGTEKGGVAEADTEGRTNAIGDHVEAEGKGGITGI